MAEERFYPILKIKYDFEIAEIDGDTVAVAVENGADSFHGVINLQNESAVYMFKLLQRGINLPDLIYLCTKEFNEEVETVGPVVIEFLDALKAEGILVPVFPPDFKPTEK